jgi:2-keto-3-deoxy-L-rhamnonate aldolase RhmA
MRKNETKAKLNRGETVFGSFANVPAPSTVEALGYLGFDFVILDGEHSPVDQETIENMVRAADVAGITPIARIALNQPQVLLRYLDSGCLGVEIPMVNTQEEAQRVADAVRYPPRGIRGLAGVRANEWGLTRSLGEYVKIANDEIICIVQIETKAAFENVKAIASLPEVDMVFVGPTDTSSALGFPGETQHPEVMAVLERMGKAIRDAGKHAGTIGFNKDHVSKLHGWGYNYFANNVQGMLIAGGRSYLADCKAGIK